MSKELLKAYIKRILEYEKYKEVPTKWYKGHYGVSICFDGRRNKKFVQL